jgi:hypothetical protein
MWRALWVILAAAACGDDVEPPASCPPATYPVVICAALSDVDECVRFEGACVRACTDGDQCSFASDRLCALNNFPAGPDAYCYLAR